MKRLIADIRHPAHLNFFRPVLQILKSEGWNIDVVAIDRGRVLRITRNEYKGFKVTKIGRHRGTKLSIILEANILRFFQMFGFVYKNEFNIGISVSSFILGSTAKLNGVPNLQFYDDPEYKKHVYLQRITSTKTYYPKIKEFGSEIETFNALKEWAYLSPKYYTPNKNVLREYGLTEKKYIFIREVINTSLNYTDQKSSIISKIAHHFPEGYNVLLSLEDKKNKHLYPKEWILLQEPLKDIHSLMYHSIAVVSSGDSMAREGAMLGVPSIYCGIRKMAANQKMIDLNMLFHTPPEEVSSLLNNIINKKVTISSQAIFRDNLMADWDDVTLFIKNKILQFAK